MNHDFLLKTETAGNTTSGTQSQAAVNRDGSEKSELNQIFSAELGKQIDKQAPVEKAAESNEISSDSVKIAESTSSQKAEKLLDENGKPLPTQNEVVEKFVDQLLNDVNATPALKQELTQAIEQFVEAFLNSEETEQPLGKSLTELITQLVKATSGQSIGGEGQKSISEKETADFRIKPETQETIKDILRGLDNAKTDVSDPTIKATLVVAHGLEKTAQTKPNQPGVNPESQTKVINSTVSSFIPVSEEVSEKMLGQKRGLNEQLSVAPIALTKNADQKSGQTEQIERVQTVLQQIKEAILKDVTSDSPQKTDKASRIAGLVKKIMPEKVPSIGKVQTALTDRSQPVPTKEAPSLIKLRADILQALPTKPLGSTSTLDSKTVENSPVIITKPDIINSDDKRTERLLQLIDLIKPAKLEEPSQRSVSFDRAVPTTLASISTVTSSPSLAKAGLPTLDIQPTLQSKAWNRVLSSRVIWMASEGIQQAALKLNPANLGPVEVRLHLQNEQASVSFIAHNVATREALEQALPRLRESFVENGLELTDAEVSDQASHEANEDGSQNNNNKDSQGNDVTAMNGKEAGSEQAVTDVKQENELGVNVFA